MLLAVFIPVNATNSTEYVAKKTNFTDSYEFKKSFQQKNFELSKSAPSKDSVKQSKKEIAQKQAEFVKKQIKKTAIKTSPNTLTKAKGGCGTYGVCRFAANPNDIKRLTR